jgi:two-component system, NarL family, nitrate/nitrite response regulator NarL
MDVAARVDGGVIQIILADSQAVYRLGIRQALTSEIDMRVVAQADALEGVHRAVECLSRQSPTQGACQHAIILLDSNMISGMVGAISELVRRAPEARIITQLDKGDESSVVELYRRGVRGVIPRSVSPDLLIKCIRKIAAGEIWIDNQSVNRLIEAYRAHIAKPRPQRSLSPRELAIITCITQSKRNKEIAYQLGTTEQVVKNYLRKIYNKLGVCDRLELANYGFRHQLHKTASESGVSPGVSVPVPDIQSKLNSESGDYKRRPTAT